MSDLGAIDKRNIWHPFTPLVNGPEHILIESAKGVNLYTKDGKKIIDAVSSWWVNIHGHSHPAIADALYEQAKKLEHVIFAGFTHEPAITLSQALLEILPKNQSKIFFSDNGSTAVEVGLKMAVQYWENKGIQKKKVIAIEGAYHGDTFGAMAVGDRGLFTKPFHPYLFDVDFISFPEKGQEENTIEQFKKIIASDEAGVFIFEPLVQGSAGMRMYSASVLDKLIALAHEHQVICVADEVFTGFGRTGKLFASDHLKNKPDIIAISKGITGGTMALGVTTCSEKITEAFQTSDFTKTFFHGHSYTANPLACAAANASMKLLLDDNCAKSISMIEKSHETFAQEMENHRQVRAARSLGTILALEIETAGETSYENDLRKKIYPYFLERGILLRPLGNIIYVLPPYVIKQDELHLIYAEIKKFLDLL